MVSVGSGGRWFSGVMVGKIAGQLAVGVDLLKEQLGLLLEGGNRVGPGGGTKRRLVLGDEVD